MKYVLFGSAILMIFVVGCGDSMKTHSLAQVTQVSETTTCEVVSPINCVGQFGFTIDRMGNFTAGPSPSGKTVTGQITPAEVAAFQGALTPIVESSTMSCAPSATVPGVSDQILASFTDGTQANLYSTSGQLCFRGSAADGAAFRDLFHLLLAEYYPNPFPL